MSSVISSCSSTYGDFQSPHCLIATNDMIDLVHSHLQMVAGVCVEFYVSTYFTSVKRTRVFLDMLELYVLNDRFNYVAPEVIAHFI